jgi:hypothetical protein
MASILGKTRALIKVISSKDLGMVMEFGVVILKKVKLMKVIICSIKNMDMEYIPGEMDIIIKEILLKI